MSEQLPDEVNMQIQRFKVALKKFEGIIDGSLSKPYNQIDKELTPLQRSVHYLGVARAVYHAYLLLLRTQGLVGKGHPINAESDRLKAYGKKVRKLESAEYLATHKPTTELNIAAANRFINHAIPDLNPEQKAALKQVTGKRKERQEMSSSESPAEQARAFLEQTLGSISKRKKA